MKQKRCTKCQTFKDVSNFGRQKTTSDGLKSWCNSCMTTASVAYQKAHPEKRLQNGRTYRKKHIEKLTAYMKNWLVEHIDQKRETDRKYSAAHREEARVKAAAWYAANKERAAATNRAYRAKKADAIRATKSAYSKSHSIERKALEHKRRANKRGNGGKYTKTEFVELCQKYGNRCLMCGRDDVKLTADHVIPISLGGSNFIENIQPLCVCCNSKKHTTFLDLR